MKSVNEIYKDALRQILDHGQDANPRGTITKELLGFQTRIKLDDCIITNKVRNLNYAFSVAEWLWILFGRDDVEFISRFNKNISCYSDNGLTFYGAYGPRIIEQLMYVYKELKQDPHSRRAVLTTWRRNPQVSSKDIPCTVGLHFLVRNNKLNCFSWMRSNDAWLGMPYDIFNFSQLSNVLAGLLNVERGELIYNADSLHLYNNHFTQARLASNEVLVELLKTRVNKIKIDGYTDFECWKLSFDKLCDVIHNEDLSLEIVSQFPVGMKEHLELLVSYVKEDSSHRKGSFWKEIYEKRK